MPLTPADVRNKQFSTTRLRPGYDEEEVDAFLDEVEAELDRLIQENEELRAKLSEVLRGGKAPVAAAPNAPHVEPPPEQLMPEPPRHEPERPPPPRASDDEAARGQHGHRGSRPGPRPADRRPGDRRRQARGRRDAGPRPARGRRHPDQGPSAVRADHQRRQGARREPRAGRSGAA